MQIRLGRLIRITSGRLDGLQHFDDIRFQKRLGDAVHKRNKNQLVADLEFLDLVQIERHPVMPITGIDEGDESRHRVIPSAALRYLHTESTLKAALGRRDYFFLGVWPFL